MRRVLCVIAILIAGCTTQQSDKKINNHETKGNLQRSSPSGCASLADVSNMHTPADLFPDVLACIKSGEYEKAAPLYALAGAYGRFDQLRVTDNTARQAIQALQADNFGNLSDERQEGFRAAMLATTEDGSPSFKKLCSDIARMGPPKYFPTYMIQHGMAAFTGSSGNGVSADFNPNQGWHQVMTGYLHCP